MALRGLLFAVFLSAGDSLSYGGRLPTASAACAPSILTILCYSLFTFLGWMATSVWQLALFRFLAGAESAANGPWAVSSSRRNGRRAGVPKARHTCTPATTSARFSAAIVNYAIGAKYGWRAVFAVGGAPALLVAFIRYGVAEPKRWQHRMQNWARPLQRGGRSSLFLAASTGAGRCSTRIPAGLA